MGPSRDGGCAVAIAGTVELKSYLSRGTEATSAQQAVWLELPVTCGALLRQSWKVAGVPPSEPGRRTLGLCGKRAPQTKGPRGLAKPQRSRDT